MNLNVNTRQAFKETLSTQLRQPLPGLDAQLKMANVIRSHISKNFKMPDNVKKAAVLILNYYKDGAWHIALMKRVPFDPEKDKHSGQVSFPGGRYELEDKDLEETAVRESEEEIGIKREEIQVLGSLTPLYIPISNFHVYPYVAIAEQDITFVPSPDEVETLLEIPLSAFLDFNNRKTKNITTPTGMKLKDVPYFDIDNYTIWGATAMMLSEYVDVLLA